MDVDDLALGDIDVHGGIHVDEVITGQHGRFEGFLHTVHGILDGPFLGPLPVLQPGAAVVDGDDDGAGEMHPLGLETDQPGELLLGHAGITAVAVDLVKGGCEVDGGVVALGGAQGGADDGGGVGARCEDGARNSGLLPQGVQFVKQFFCLRHSLIHI